MISVFDLDKLYGLLKDFYDISHIRITVFDENLKELVSYPDSVAPYCAVIRGCPQGYAACVECDREAAKRAKEKHSTYIYRCHAGLTEAVTPLYVGDFLVGYLFFGHVFSYGSHEYGWRVIEAKCSSLPLNMRMLEDAICEALPIGEAYIRSAAHIMLAVASHLISERMATLKEDILAVKMDAYISAHFTEKLSADRVADYLEIGKTQLYDLSRQLYGCGIAAHIRDLRISLAKDLLSGDKRLSIAEIADQCGYSDYNYFITVFSRETGMTPKAWKKQS